MSDPLVKLTIVVPAILEAALTESLLGLVPPVGAFTTLHGDGHGQSFDRASTVERVSGRAARLMVIAIFAPSEAQRVIEHVKEKLSVPHASWWIEPVLAFGRFQ